MNLRVPEIFKPEKKSAVIFIAAAIYLYLIWTHTFFLMQDYPDWLFQGHSLARLLKGNPVQGLKPRFWPPYPNLIGTFLIGFINLILPITTAGKLVLSLYVILFLFTIKFLLDKKNAPTWTYFFGTILCMNDYFFTGNLNFMLSLPILLLGIYFTYSITNHKLAFFNTLIFSTILYLTHPISFLTFFVFLFLITIKRKNFLYLLGIIPFLILIIFCIFNFVTNSSNVVVNNVDFEFRGFLYSKFSEASAFYIFYYPSEFILYENFAYHELALFSLLNVIFVLICFYLLLSAILWAIKDFKKYKRLETIFFLWLLFCAIILPIHLFNICSPHERFAFLTILFLICFIRFDLKGKKLITIVLFFILILSIVYNIFLFEAVDNYVKNGGTLSDIEMNKLDIYIQYKIFISYRKLSRWAYFRDFNESEIVHKLFNTGLFVHD